MGLDVELIELIHDAALEARDRYWDALEKGPKKFSELPLPLLFVSQGVARVTQNAPYIAGMDCVLDQSLGKGVLLYTKYEA